MLRRHSVPTAPATVSDAELGIAVVLLGVVLLLAAVLVPLLG